MFSLFSKIEEHVRRLTISKTRLSGNIPKGVPPQPVLAGLDEEQKKKIIYAWIKEGIACFREWYQPVDFGNGVIAHMTVPPDWKPRVEALNNKEGGLPKWDYILKKHLPDLRGKRVLDLGSSSGLFCLEMAKMGAREVVGIDRNENIEHRSTRVPPPQDVVAQAEFVKKAFELLHNTTYPISYIAHDIGSIRTLNLEKFDAVLAANVVYHELGNMPELVRQLGKITDHLILQTCLVHGGELGRWASLQSHTNTLLAAGFRHIEIDAPEDYPLPVIIGRML